jgi:uncharacterized protein
MNPLRLVLDTNIWLDHLVFDDPAVKPIFDAIATGRASAITNTEALSELERVLGYIKFRVAPEAQAAKLAVAKEIALEWPEDAHLMGIFRTPCGTNTLQNAVRLPRCADPDDQKFLVLAQASNAHYLVTKDKALLTLNRAKYRLPFRIVKVQEMTEVLFPTLA